jgi:hypothetical protein
VKALAGWKLDLIISSDAGTGFQNRSNRTYGDLPSLAPELATNSAFGVQLSQTMDIVYSNVGSRPNPRTQHPPIWLVSPNFPANTSVSDPEYDESLPGTGKLSSLVNRMNQDPAPPFGVQHGEPKTNKEDLQDYERKSREDAAREDYRELAELLLSDRQITVELMNSMGNKWSDKDKQSAFLRSLASEQEQDRIRSEYEWATDLRKQINRDRILFTSASTLNDNWDPVAAKALFMYGRLLVLTSWDELRTSLDEIARTKVSP